MASSVLTCDINIVNFYEGCLKKIELASYETCIVFIIKGPFVLSLIYVQNRVRPHIFLPWFFHDGVFKILECRVLTRCASITLGSRVFLFWRVSVG